MITRQNLKKTIEFNLPEDAEEYELCKKSKNMYYAMVELYYHIQDKSEHCSLYNPDILVYDDTLDYFENTLNKYGVKEFI